MRICIVLFFAMAAAVARAGSEPLPPAFDRIVHGWTNYSTAFNATHDTGASGDYASIGELRFALTNSPASLQAAILLEQSLEHNRWRVRRMGP